MITRPLGSLQLPDLNSLVLLEAVREVSTKQLFIFFERDWESRGSL